MRPIDADALENMGYELHRTYQKDASTMVYEVRKIGEIPTIEVEPVRRGRWLKPQKCAGGYIFKCSLCGKGVYHMSDVFYCPNCGAKMENKE